MIEENTQNNKHTEGVQKTSALWPEAIEKLFCSPGVQEIFLYGPNQIYFVERNRHKKLAESVWNTHKDYQEFTASLCDAIASPMDIVHPWAEGHWNQLRIHIAGPAVTNGMPSICIRKPFPLQQQKLDDLVNSGWGTSAQVQHLKRWIQQKFNFLVVGPTGAGKTTLLQACLNEIPESERILICQDSAELRPPHANSVACNTRRSGLGQLPEISLQDLIRNALRMSASRVVLGEVRGAEAKDLILALSSGHSGSLGSLHAHNAREALVRLELLIHLGAPQWNRSSVLQLIHLSLQGIAVVAVENGKHRLRSLEELTGLETQGILLDPLC